MDVNHGKWISIFNSALGTQWTLERKHGRLVVDSAVINVPAGSVWTNIGDSSNYLMQRSYSTALRALLAAHQRGMDVHSSTYDGRPAWTVKLAYDTAKGVVIRLTIDQQTGLVFASGQYKNGQPEWESRIENVRINQPLARSLFRPPAALHLDLRRAIPAGSDYGYKRVPVARVESLVGYAPLVPARVPDGYVLSDVTALPKSEKRAIGGQRSLVSMVYRRGLSSFTVALMPDKDGNPFADPGGGAVTAGNLSQHITLSGGELNGSRADIFIGLWAQTAQIFVWCEGVPLNVMIRGDLTRDELVAVAESLQVYGGDQ